MNHIRAALGIWAALTAALGPGSVLAQVPAQAPGKARGAEYSPLRRPVQAADPMPHLPPPRPTDFLGYMSAECASMHDGLRTAPARGRSISSQAELRAEYQRRCAAEEAQARHRWAYEQRGAQIKASDQQYRAREEAEEQQARQQQTVEQCLEMRRIITGKNARLAQLTPGEVADLRRFESNYAARCPMFAR